MPTIREDTEYKVSKQSQEREVLLPVKENGRLILSVMWEVNSAAWSNGSDFKTAVAALDDKKPYIWKRHSEVCSCVLIGQ